MGQYEGMSEEDSRDTLARGREKKKKKLHHHLMKQMREIQGGDSDSELDDLEDISVPSSAPRTRTKKVKVEVKQVKAKTLSRNLILALKLRDG